MTDIYLHIVARMADDIATHLGRDFELQRIRVPSVLEQSLGVHLRRVTRQGRPWERQEVKEKRAG